jgi:glycogen debranching enzyme
MPDDEHATPAASGSPEVRRHTRKDGQTSRNVLKVGSDFYVLASSLASRRIIRVLTHAENFAIFDVDGDIPEVPLEAVGFFHRDTRYLSHFEFRIAGRSPYFLDSYLSDDSAQLRVNQTNPDLLGADGAIELPRDSIQIERRWVLNDATLFHRSVVRNFAGVALAVPLQFGFGVDFADMFEVRGVKRKRHGEFFEPQVGTDSVRFKYRGLDGTMRYAEINFDTAPSSLNSERAAFSLSLGPNEKFQLEVRITGESERESAQVRDHAHRRGSVMRVKSFDHAVEARRSGIVHARAGWASVSGNNQLFDSLLKRSAADVTSMISRTTEGTFIMAGIPWFATLFGRDSLITTMAVMPFNPDIAAATLQTLAGLQGSKIDERRDEQPGKIVHEIRDGEMAATGEVPFARYYGSVDSTPLFLWVFGRFVETTGNLEFAEQLWPNVLRALEWIERWGDRDGDGYVEYLRETPRGLANQGWKDSFDAISHRDGQLAHPPIALAEVQGYVYAAYIGVAKVASRLGHSDIACKLNERADLLRRAFSRDFWLEDEGMVALALDGNKRPCRVMSSNASHCLATGLLDADQAGALSKRLLADDMFTGWGIRTLSAREHRYNPMSYHNGSVWPHDNAIAAMGLAQYGDHKGALRILKGLFDAATNLGRGSLPELFCGFPREEGVGPVPYPVACHPQAWSAASVYLMLQAVLGLRVLGFEKEVVVGAQSLPSWLEALTIEKLAIGSKQVSFKLQPTLEGTTLEVLQKPDSVSVELWHSR